MRLTRETASDPPQTYWATLREAGRRLEERQVTNFPHPYPQVGEGREATATARPCPPALVLEQPAPVTSTAAAIVRTRGTTPGALRCPDP